MCVFVCVCVCVCVFVCVLEHKLSVVSFKLLSQTIVKVMRVGKDHSRGSRIPGAPVLCKIQDVQI